MAYRITLRNSSGGVLDEKEGDEIADLLRDYAADGCLSGGDTLEIEEIDDLNLDRPGQSTGRLWIGLIFDRYGFDSFYGSMAFCRLLNLDFAHLTFRS